MLAGKNEFDPLRYVVDAERRRGRDVWLDARACQAYLALYEELRSAVRPQPRRRVSFEAGCLLGRAVLGLGRLECVTFICVSDYVGGPRFLAQGGRFQLTAGERQLLAKAGRLRLAAVRSAVPFRWQVILADGWGELLYRERTIPGALDRYCDFLAATVVLYGFTTVRWTSLMQRHADVYEQARSCLGAFVDEHVAHEARQRQVGHGRLAPEEARRIAAEHIAMRAAEGPVIVHDRGPTVVLSTEGPSKTRYDNVLVPRAVYERLFIMPHYPHRLP